jgi:hypothetical protein
MATRGQQTVTHVLTGETIVLPVQEDDEYAYSIERDDVSGDAFIVVRDESVWLHTLFAYKVGWLQRYCFFIKRSFTVLLLKNRFFQSPFSQPWGTCNNCLQSVLFVTFALHASSDRNCVSMCVRQEFNFTSC